MNGQNETLFEQRRLERKANLGQLNEGMQPSLGESLDSPKFWEGMEDLGSELFWGYGVRPGRLAVWMMVALVLFAVIYRTQIHDVGFDTNWLRVGWAKWRVAVSFSAQTAWKFGFGYAHSRTRLFKMITLIQLVLFKVLFSLFLQAIANVSPLANELARKLLPL